MVPVAPSFLSPFDVAPSSTHVAPEATSTTPIIVDYWRLIVRERRHLLVPVLLASLIALVVGLRTTPVYEATSSVTFESTKGPVSIQDVGGGLAGVVMDAPIGSVDADLVGADRDLDGVLECLAGVGVTRALTVSVVSEAEKPECFHATFNYEDDRTIPTGRASRVTRLRPLPSLGSAPV